MGLNGSGKSTLLKLISGVMHPDGGTVLTRGRVAGLIATGAGFQPQLSGRDNLWLNAAILGMSEAETRRKFDEIVDFADLGKFLDTPVTYYSSGMKARLGFAVAINVEADIFIADEALAVGDRPFKRKCKQRMREIRENGTTIFFVSHAPGAVRQLCDRVLVLEKGKLGFDGDVEEGIKYLHYDDDETTATTTRASARTTDATSRELEPLAPGWLACGVVRFRHQQHDRALPDEPAKLTIHIGVSTGNYRFVVTQFPLPGPCDGCETCYSCDSSPTQEQPPMRPSQAHFVTSCQQLLALGAVLAVLTPAAAVDQPRRGPAGPRHAAPGRHLGRQRPRRRVLRLHP